MHKIRIVHVVEAFEGGVLTYLHNVLPKLNSYGYRVTLICSPNRNWPALEKTVASLRGNGIRVLILSMSRRIRPLVDAIALAKLCKILMRDNFDIVHTHCSKAGALGRIAAKIVGIKTIVHTPHCFSFLRCDGPIGKWSYLTIERLLGKITSKLVCVSDDEASVAVKSQIVPLSRCTHVNNSLKDSHNPERELSSDNEFSLRRAFNIPQNFRVVLTVCRLIQYKGVFGFIEAARLSETPRTMFLVVGEGNLRSTAEEWIKKQGLGHKVGLIGHVGSIEKLYNIADVVVLCSRAEGQSYVLLEAMRAGKPIVATSVPGNTSVIEHDINGYLVSPNAVSIAGAVDYLLSNESARRRYGRNARAHFCKYHLLDNQIAKLNDLYAQLVPIDFEAGNA